MSRSILTRPWIRELAGWLGALAVGVIVTAQVASTARGALLTQDGDSLVVAMFARSLLDGQGANWAMSSVLFLPETAVFALLRGALPLGVNALLLVNAVINVVGLYGALRLAAGRRAPGRAPAAWAFAATTAFGVMAVTELSTSREALELASLLLTTTYYSATVIAMIASIGLARRAVDGAGRAPLIALAVIAAVSTLSNPLYAVWTAVPLGVVGAIGALRATARARMITLLWWLGGGTVVGLLARIPFASWIENSGLGYVHPEQWPMAAGHYARLLAERLSTPWGWLGAFVILGLLVLAVRRTVRASSRGARLVAATAWMLPLLVTIGAIGLGTNAARYLEPVVFAPLLALVAEPRALRPHASRAVMAARASRVVTAVVCVLLLVGSAISIPRLAAQARTPDADVQCVTDWVADSGRTGAGQFWTVRLPKLHLSDPSRLVQVDHRLHGYSWLVDRDDFAAREVSFLIEDAQTVNWELPLGAAPTAAIPCGRYTIYDFAPEVLPLRPPRS